MRFDMGDKPRAEPLPIEAGIDEQRIEFPVDEGKADRADRLVLEARDEDLPLGKSRQQALLREIGTGVFDDFRCVIGRIALPDGALDQPAHGRDVFTGREADFSLARHG